MKSNRQVNSPLQMSNVVFLESSSSSCLICKTSYQLSNFSVFGSQFIRENEHSSCRFLFPLSSLGPQSQSIELLIQFRIVFLHLNKFFLTLNESILSLKIAVIVLIYKSYDTICKLSFK